MFLGMCKYALPCFRFILFECCFTIHIMHCVHYIEALYFSLIPIKIDFRVVQPLEQSPSHQFHSSLVTLKLTSLLQLDLVILQCCLLTGELCSIPVNQKVNRHLFFVIGHVSWKQLFPKERNYIHWANSNQRPLR